ncbi:MAG: hypothetical protein IJ568_06795 [Bacilli bacterium]|nr:hypothetical protein [Bacilli bacterium]
MKFIEQSTKFDEISYNICYTNLKKSDTSLYVFGATESKKIESIELYNNKTNKKINSKDIDLLITELGFHSYGKHLEKAKVTYISNTVGFGFDENNNKFSNLKMTIEFENGLVVDANYRFYKTNDKINLLKINNSYLFEFEVINGITNPIQYIISDFEIN